MAFSTAYFIVQVRSPLLRELAEQIDAGQITTNVREVIDLSRAHEGSRRARGEDHS